MPASSYDNFKKIYHNPKNPMSECAQFKLYIQKELEDRLSKMPDMGFDDEAPTQDANKSTAESKMSKFLMKMEKKKAKDLAKSGVKSVDKGPKRIKIAQITFAFYNGEVMNWLYTRGSYIQNEKWDKLGEINKTISEGLKNKDLLDRCQTPCSCFVTFESEEGY